jgi:Undecaprenyl-phosphate glucose phosphotransferase
MVGWYGLTLLGFALVRGGALAQVRAWRRRGRLARTVAIVVLSEHGHALVPRLCQRAGEEIRLVGVFGMVGATDRKNGLDDLLALARIFRIDEVIVALPGKTETAADAVIRRLGTIPTNVRLAPELPPLDGLPLEPTLLYGLPMLTVYHKPLSGWNRVVKRAEDLLLASLATLLVLPLLACLAIAIKMTSPGPVLFQQKRLGFNNNPIVVYKFRTMVHRSEAETDIPQAVRGDPRVTRLGRLLRRSSLDELPQLLNVLRGNMSLIGPRPHALVHNELYAAQINEYLGRHRVQPGITGWAQVNGLRGETNTLDKMKRRVEHDLDYIDRWSLALDLKILLLTVVRCAFDRNAY